MNQILRCDWLPDGPILPARESHIIHVNPLLTKLVQSRWLEFMDLISVWVHKHVKKELANI